MSVTIQTGNSVTVQSGNRVLISAPGPQGPAGAAGAGEWGDITGTLSDQTDLASELANKVTDGGTVGSLTFQPSGLLLADASNDHYLTLGFVESTQNGTLNVYLNEGAARTLTISGNATINGTNTGNVSLAGTPDYLTISGQTITRGLIDQTTDVTGTLPVGNGGTGATTISANAVILGNGTSAVQTVAPSTSGNVLTSNGTTWTSATPSTTNPAGSGSELQFRSSGTAFGAVTGSSVSGANISSTGTLTLTKNAAASTPTLRFTGDIVTGTGTTATPLVLIQPADATNSTTWSTSGTVLGYKMGTITPGNLIDFKFSNDVSVFSVTNGGNLTAGGNIVAGVSMLCSSSQYLGFNGSTLLSAPANGTVRIQTSTATNRVNLAGDADDILAQRNSTAAQTYRIYNTYTSSTNHERASLGWASNVFQVKPEKGSGGGTSRTAEYHTTETGVRWTSGAGTPEGAVTAPVGSLFTRTDGGASTTLYVKESGSGNTGWIAK